MDKFKSLVESKCRSVDSEFLAVDGKTSLLRYATATDLGKIANRKCCVCGKERVTKLPKYFKWPWKDEEY